MVDDAVELFVGNEAGEVRADLQVPNGVEVFQRRQSDRRQPDL